MDDNPGLYKRFSIGLSLETTVNQYRRILDTYENYIYDIFFSLPLGKMHHTRGQTIQEFAKPGANDQFFSILKLMKSRGIKLEVALNSPMLKEEHIEESLEYISKYIDFDSIVTLESYGYIINERFPDKALVYSYNNEIREKRQIDLIPPVFQEVVLGSSFIRDIDAMSSVREKGFRCKLLVNNGCSFNCMWCSHASACRPAFLRNLERFTPEELYSLQSLFPWELHKYILSRVDIDRIKISSRPSNYDYLNKCLYSYIANEEREFIKEPGYYNLWGRLGHFSRYYDTFDFNRINDIKEKIWTGQKVFEFN